MSDPKNRDNRILKDSVCRSVEFLGNKEGKHYFLIREGVNEVYLSDLYDDIGECCQIGFEMLDCLHERMPVHNDRVDFDSEQGVKNSG